MATTTNPCQKTHGAITRFDRGEAKYAWGEHTNFIWGQTPSGWHLTSIWINWYVTKQQNPDATSYLLSKLSLFKPQRATKKPRNKWRVQGYRHASNTYVKLRQFRAGIVSATIFPKNFVKCRNKWTFPVAILQREGRGTGISEELFTLCKAV